MEVVVNACTFASDLQMPFTRVSIYSFIQHNKWFTGTIYILNYPDIPLSDSNLKLLQLIYPNISSIKVEDCYFLNNIKKNRPAYQVQVKEYCKIYAFSLNMSLLYFSNTCIFTKDVADLLHHQKIIFTPGRDLMYIGKKVDLFDQFVEKKSLNITSFFDEWSADDSCETKDHFVIHAASINDNKFSQLDSSLQGAHCISYSDLVLNSNRDYLKIKQVWLHKNKETDAALFSPRRIDFTVPVKNQKAFQKKESPAFLEKPLFGTTASSEDPIKIVLCTICSDPFIRGTKVLIYSFLVNNPWFDHDIVIFHNKVYSPLSNGNRSELKRIYTKIIFMEVNEKDYLQAILNFKKIPGSNPRFIPSLFTFEAFSLAINYEKILYLDSDMVVRSDISELFSLNFELAVTPDTSRYLFSNSYERFNGGFMLINGKLTRKKNYRYDLIKQTVTSKNLALADQTVMNTYFKKSVTYLSSQYNCLKRCFPDENFKNFDPSIKIIHYVGAKPWQSKYHASEKKYSNLEKIWKDYELSLTNRLQNKKNDSSLDRDKLLILTSSFEGDLTPFLNGEFMVFSTNWGICHGIPIDYYFCAADEPKLISEINSKYDLIRKWIIIDSIANRLNSKIDKSTVTNLFDFFSTRNLVGKSHVLPKSVRGDLNLPTSGVQMVCAAADFSISRLVIRGVNLYSMKNSNGGYKMHGNTYLENPYTMPTKPHDLATDLALLHQAFKKLLSQSTEIDTDAPILNELLELIKKETPVNLCHEILSKKYY